MPNLSSPVAIAIQEKDHNPSSKTSSDPNGKKEMSVVSAIKVAAHEEEKATYSVTIPPGVRPGGRFAVMLGGTRHEFTCPEGAGPGSTVHVQGPAPSSGSESSGGTNKWNCENCHVNNEAKDLFCLECYFKKPDDRKMVGRDEPIESPSTSVNISLDLLEVDRPTGHSDGHHNSCLKEFIAIVCAECKRVFTTPQALAAEAILLVMITITTLLNIELYSTGGLNGSSGCIVTYDAQAYRFKSFSVDNVFLYRYESYPNINNITDTVRAATLALTRITMAWNIAMFTMVCGAVFFVNLIINETNELATWVINNRNAVICFGLCGYLGQLFGMFGGIVCILVLLFDPLLIGITLENYEKGFGVGETYCSTYATSPRCCQQAALAVIGSSGYTILFGWFPAVVILLYFLSNWRERPRENNPIQLIPLGCVVFVMLCLQLPGIGIQMGALFGSN